MISVCLCEAVRKSEQRYGRFVNRPYGTEQNIICRGDHILAEQVCHEAKRNIESPV